MRQSYLPQPRQQPEISPQPRMRNYHTYGRTVNSPKIVPIDPVTNCRLFLYTTKQKLEYKQACQFGDHHPLTKEQPHFLYKPEQTEKANLIKFQAYLEGEITPSEYLQLQNFRKYYSKIRSDRQKTDNIEDEYEIKKESALKKLKERILYKYKMDRRMNKKDSIILKVTNRRQESSPIEQIKKCFQRCIINKNLNLNKNNNNKFNQSLQSIKMIRAVNDANQQFLTKSQNKDLICSNFQKPYYESSGRHTVQSKQMRIIKSVDNIDKSDYESTYMMKQEMQRSIDKQREECLPILTSPVHKILKFKDLQMSRVRTEASQYSLASHAESKTFRILRQIQETSRNDSGDDSLQSLFEKNIDSLYHQSIQLQNNISANEQQFTKRIRNIQSVYELNDKLVKTNQMKLI